MKTTLAILCLLAAAVLNGSACGPDPEELRGLAAVYNTTDQELVTTVSGATVQAAATIRPGEFAIFEVRQSAQPIRFALTQGDKSVQTKLTLVSGGETPLFKTVIVTVSFDADTDNLATASGVSSHAFYSTASRASSSPSSFLMMINESNESLGIEKPGEGSLFHPGAHGVLTTAQGISDELSIRTLGPEPIAGTLSFTPPLAADSQPSAFVAFLEVTSTEIAIDMRPAKLVPWAGFPEN